MTGPLDGTFVVDIRSRAAGNPDELPSSQAIHELRRAEPALGIVAHGDRAERYLATQALTAGASAYVSRGAGPEELRLAVSAFTLAWSHTVEHLPWQEDWRVDGDRGPETALPDATIHDAPG